MKHGSILLVATIWLGWAPWLVFAQGDLALHATFSRYSPSVYSIKAQIPREFFIQQYEQTILELKEYQDSFANFVANATEIDAPFGMFDNYIDGFEQQLIQLKQQSQKGHYLKGAGFAVHPHYMVTLSTVVQSATYGGDIVVINEYQQVRAVLQGVDQLTGVAVLRVDDATFHNIVDISTIAQPLPETAMVLSIQRPYDLPASPVSGIIGGYHRRMNLFQMEQFIQSDIRLYPGNEGAPVFSPAGQLVGMIAKEYRYADWPGVTFIIPSELLIDSVHSIIRTGKRERGWVPGIVLKQDKEGILIEQIKPDSLAVQAGLMKGDLIIGFQDGEERNLYNFRNHLLHSRPNEMVKFLVKRGDRISWVDVRTSPVELVPINQFE